MALRNAERWKDALKVALGPLMPLLEDDDVNEICVNAYNDAWVKRYSMKGFQREPSVKWPSVQSLQTACTRITEVTGRRVNERKPIYDGRLPGGERINIVVPPACAKVSITIRKFPLEPMTLDMLQNEHEAIDGNVRDMLEAFIHTHQNLICAGPTGSGKTSLLNALARVIPEDERIVTDEDVRELQIVQPNWVALETVEAVDSEMEAVEFRHLVKSNLRQTPSRIFVGEVRGDEALFLARALSTGHVGYGTVHANSGIDALEQVQLLAALTPGINVSWFGLAKLVAKAIHIVVFADVFGQDGSKKVREIIQVEGVEVLNALDTRFKVRTLARFEPREIIKKENGRAKLLGGWVFPDRPTPELEMLLKAHGLAWPWNQYTA